MHWLKYFFGNSNSECWVKLVGTSIYHFNCTFLRRGGWEGGVVRGWHSKIRADVEEEVQMICTCTKATLDFLACEVGRI